jgi:hypothetical protein
MAKLVSFTAGFVTGWLARSTVDGSREAFVKLGAFAYNVAHGMRRIVALERERADDLAAEARARARHAREHDGVTVEHGA